MDPADPKHFEECACVICGKSDLTKIADQGQHGLPVHVVICRSCGLSFLNPRWKKEVYKDFYRTEYDKYYRTYLAGKEDQPAASHEDSSLPIIPSFERMKAAGIFPSNVSTLLDIGSGSGGFINQARMFFSSAVFSAIEPSEGAAGHLKKYGIERISDDVDSDWQKGREGTFDLVHMRHVLEHFSDPLSVLRKVRNVLSEEGIVYIAVPNSMKPALPILEHFFRAVHTYYFNRKSLLYLMGIAGLEAVLVIDGDSYNKNELAIVAKRGKIMTEGSNSFEEQMNCFMAHVHYEQSAAYKLKKVIKKITGIGS